MPTVRHVLLTIVVLTHAACGDSRSQADTKESATEIRNAPKSIDKPAAAAPQEKTAPPVTPSAANARLALDGEGLRLFDASSGSARLIAFGIPVGDAMKALKAVQGEAPVRQGENIDCGARYAEWRNGLTTWFARDRFVGWSVQRGSNALATASNVGVGSTREELRAAYDAKIAPSSLGTEFTAGGIAGLLESSKPNARIINLWAGVACVAR